MLSSGIWNCTAAKQVIRRLYSKSVPLKLIVPSLNQTLEKYARYVKPLVSDPEFERTKEIIQRFSLANGEGEKLQKLLLERAQKMDNWLSDWWTNVAYLEIREPIVISSNPGVRLPTQSFKDSNDWIRFSVDYLTGFLQYKLLIDSDRIPQERLKDDPLCMSQYYTLFSTCRIPGIKRDEVFSVRSHLLKPHERPTYITVVHKNRFFTMDVIDRKTQRIYSKEALFRGFCKILDMSQTKGQPLGLMTAENRNVWGTTFEKLKEFPINRKSFESLQNSILLFCLDGNVFPPSLDNERHDDEQSNSIVACNSLHGNGHKVNSANRWFDKTIQLIVSSDGVCGLNYEHTPAEAPPLLNILEYTFGDRKETEGNVSVGPEVAVVEEMEFSLDPTTRQNIDVAKTNISSLVNDLELHAVSFDKFGKKRIKACKTSPDAFVQIGIQLGYFNFHGGPGSTYESGSLRRFKQGRTDTIRSCSQEALAFCQSMKDQTATNCERKRLLISALEQHSKYTKDVLYGEGIDRHLLGLKRIAIENRLNIPDIFMDTSYSKATHHLLSTSQGGSKIDLTMCYGPLVPDGYGFCYNPMSSKILACVSAVNSNPTTNARDLARHIHEAWEKMIDILEQ